MGATSWEFLLVGTFAAVGAALAAGTLAALVRYHRTGAFPGQDETAEVPRRRLVALWLRVVVGAGVAVFGLVSLADAGLI